MTSKSNKRKSSTENCEPFNLPEFPKKLKNQRITDSSDEIDNYLHLSIIKGCNFTENSPIIKNIVMAFHYLFFHAKPPIGFSHLGLRINKVLETCKKSYGNRSNNKWRGIYRGFSVTLNGKGYELWVSINFSGSADEEDVSGLKICVGIKSSEGENHRLQLSMDENNCKYIKSENCWEISHNGKMTTFSVNGKIVGIKNDEVKQAVEKSGMKDMIYRCKETRKDRIWLGKLYQPTKFNSQDSMEFIANLFQYVIVRQKLLRVKKKKKKQELEAKRL